MARVVSALTTQTTLPNSQSHGYIGVLPVLSPNENPNSSHRQRKGFAKDLLFYNNFQVPLNSLNNNNFTAFNGPWPGLHGPSSHYVGIHGFLSTIF